MCKKKKKKELKVIFGESQFLFWYHLRFLFYREPVTESLPVTLPTFLCPASPTLPSVELALSLLDDPAVQVSEEISEERLDSKLIMCVIYFIICN